MAIETASGVTCSVKLYDFMIIVYKLHKARMTYHLLCTLRLTKYTYVYIYIFIIESYN